MMPADPLVELTQIVDGFGDLRELVNHAYLLGFPDSADVEVDGTRVVLRSYVSQLAPEPY